MKYDFSEKYVSRAALEALANFVLSNDSSPCYAGGYPAGQEVLRQATVSPEKVALELAEHCAQLGIPNKNNVIGECWALPIRQLAERYRQAKANAGLPVPDKTYTPSVVCPPPKSPTLEDLVLEVAHFMSSHPGALNLRKMLEDYKNNRK